MSPIALAFVGDGVYELMVRERLVRHGSMPAGRLHEMSVRRVKAAAQAMAYEALERVLTDKERSILKRGRNAGVSRVPRSCTPEEYHKATAVEALMGYLYLCGETARLEELFSLIQAQIAEPEE